MLGPALPRVSQPKTCTEPHLGGGVTQVLHEGFKPKGLVAHL